MAPGPYTPCPCGSGKQFKWCCGPIYPAIERALAQESQGQHETAMRLINDVVKAHPDKPEAWGQKARLLFSHNKVDEAEEALNQAFELNPNYPFGLLLRANLRWQEGEVAGALLLARRAAEAYSPEAHDFLFDAYSLIFEAEMKMQRPLAARAALRLAMRFDPAHESARDAFETLFGPQGRFPELVRKDYPFLPPAASPKGERRQTWDRTLQNAASPRLGDLARAFEELAHQDESDASAWYNLGLTRAWLGDNTSALDALGRYLELAPTDEQAAQAAALMEVLRTGAGMEEQSDYVEWSFAFPLPRDPQPLLDQLNEWRQSGRLLLPETNQEGTVYALILESAAPGLLTVGRPAADMARLAGNLVVIQQMVARLGHQQTLDRSIARNSAGPVPHAAGPTGNSAGDDQLQRCHHRGARLPHQPDHPADRGSDPGTGPEVLRGDLDSPAAPVPIGQYAAGGGRASCAAPQVAGDHSLLPGLLRPDPGRRLRLGSAPSRSGIAARPPDIVRGADSST